MKLRNLQVQPHPTTNRHHTKIENLEVNTVQTSTGGIKLLDITASDTWWFGVKLPQCKQLVAAEVSLASRYCFEVEKKTFVLWLFSRICNGHWIFNLFCCSCATTDIYPSLWTQVSDPLSWMGQCTRGPSWPCWMGAIALWKCPSWKMWPLWPSAMLSPHKRFMRR